MSGHAFVEVAGCQCLDHVDHRLKIQTEGSAVRVALTLPASTKALTTDSLQWGVRFSMSTLTYKVIFGKLVNQAAGIWHLASGKQNSDLQPRWMGRNISCDLLEKAQLM